MAEHPRLTAIPGGLDETGQGERRGTVRATRPSPRGRTGAEPRSVDREVGSTTRAAGRGRTDAIPRTGGREPLWREALGDQLRSRRLELGEKLTETAGRAGISPQYLSEVERGRKEPSSEMIEALAGALGTSLGALTRQVAEELLRYHQATPIRRPLPSSNAISHTAISPVLLAA